MVSVKDWTRLGVKGLVNKQGESTSVLKDAGYVLTRYAIQKRGRGGERGRRVEGREGKGPGNEAKCKVR